MKKLISALSMAAACFLITSCDESNVQPTENQTNSELDKIAIDVTDYLNTEGNFEAVTALLKNKVGVKLSEVVELTSKNTNDISTRLSTTAKQYDDALKGSSPEEVAIPELWMYLPEGMENAKKSDILIAFPPTGDEAEWTKVKAYTLDKKVVYLDAKAEPNVPVIVVENHGFEAFKVEVNLINKKLQASGLQNKAISTDRTARTAAEGAETTILEKIRLKDDQEPWISGAAEIYAVTSGIRNADKDVEVAVIPMYYLDKADQDYYPNQVLLFWDDYAYQAANIQLFEKDDNHNYQELVSILVSELSKLAATLSGQAWITAVGTIGSAIVDALPASFWTNDDDYVDSFYTIEKTKTYTDYYGAAANAKASLKPYFIPAN